ncbi:hypothetical protein BDFB_007819, partial [Asbolus verrucosus]
IGKVVLLILNSIHDGVMLIQIYFIFYVLNSSEFMASGSLFFTMFYILSTIYILLRHPDLVGNLSNEFTIWSTDCISKQIHNKIQAETKIITISALIVLFLAVNTGLLFLTPLPIDPEIFLELNVLKNTFQITAHCFLSCTKQFIQ